MIISQILSQLAITLCMLIDSIMIGKFLGVDELAAYGFANPVLLVFTAVGGLLSAGIQVACAGHMGKGSQESINKVYSSAIAFTAAFCAIGIAILFLLINPITSLLGAPEESEVFGLTKDYLFGFSIGIPAFLGSLILMPFLQMSGKQKLLIVAVAAMTVIDVVLDFLNVKINLFGGGIFGMGLASSLSYVGGFLIAITFFLAKKCVYKFRPAYVGFKHFVDVIKGGLPTTVNQICIVILTLIINNILANVVPDQEICRDAVAAHSVINTVMNFLYSFGTGIGSIVLILAGIFYGEEDRESTTDIIKMGLKHSLVINLIVAAVVGIFASKVTGMFLGADASMAARDFARIGLRLFCVALIPCCTTAVFKGYCQGTTRMRISELLSFAQNLFFPSIAVFILTKTGLSTYGVWTSFAIGEALTLLLYFIIAWVKAGRVSLRADVLGLLPANFGAKPEETFAETMYSYDDVIKASTDIKAFCIEQGLDDKSANALSLCVEELGNNVIKYGFHEDEDNSIEVKCVHKDDKWVLRMRDNCKSFDPTNYMKLHEEAEDKTAHIGIRLTFNLVHDASYINSLGLNNLNIYV